MLTEDEFVMLYYNLPLCPTLDRSANTIRPRSEESDGTIHLLIGRMRNQVVADAVRMWARKRRVWSLLRAAVHYRIATGPRAGRKALTLCTVASHPPPDNPCIAQLSGFSLHAGTCCRPRDRDSFERLCRHIARPAVSNERLSVNDRAQVVYRLKHPFGDSTTLASSRGSIGVWCMWSVTAIGCARDSATS